MATESTTLFRARVPVTRLRKAEKILSKLGMKPGDALNMLLAQIEICEALPFVVTTRPKPIVAPELQAEDWNKSLGPY